MYPITLTKKIEEIEICGQKLGNLDLPDFQYPWELIIWFQENIKQIIELRTKHYKEIKPSVYIGKNVKINDYVFFDNSPGQIIIDDNVIIGPFSFIEGPCYIGRDCEIKPHTQIHKKTSIEHSCKIGGEISGALIQPYSNKAHHGFIGDSYIGSWVNLGAGTTTSNLKNTYGPIRVEYKGEPIDTGLQFLGCIMGDYVKTAINTSIYTGKIIGVYAQLFGAVTKNVGSFVMDGPKGQEEFQLEAAIRTQQRMFQRRGIKQSQQYIAALEKIFQETKMERKHLVKAIE